MTMSTKKLAQSRPADSQTVMYTATERTLVKHITFINLSSTQQVIQLYHVPAGVASITPPAADYSIARSLKIAATDVVPFPCFFIMEVGDKLIGGCATGTNVNFHIDGVTGII